MAKPHPSIILTFDIDESFDTKNTRLELKRCYSHIAATTVIRTHPTEGDEPVNTIRIQLRFGARQYLHSADEGADELWNDIIEHNLVNHFDKLGNNMQIYNRRQREEGTDELMFTWLEVELQGGELAVRFHLDSESSLPAERAKLITSVRSLLNDGTLGESVTRVSIPSLASVKQQQAVYDAAAEERARQAAEQQAAEEQAQAEEKAQAEAEAEENFLESPQLEEELDEETAFHKAEEEARQSAVERYTLKEPDFVLDCRMWAVEYADGRSLTYDSQDAALLEQDTQALV